MLRNPAYAGQAAYGKTHATSAPVRVTRHARLRGQRSARISREGVAPDDWKRVSVPALVTAEQFELVQQRLKRNGRTSPRNTKRPSLLQGILVCCHCGYAYYRCSTRSKNGKLREYYRCSGIDGHRRPEGRVCANRPVRLGEVDELVWQRVLALLENPALIQTEIDRRLETMRVTHPATARREAFERDLTRASAALRRLLDGYQEQLITLDELRARTPQLRNHTTTLQAQLDALDVELQDSETYLKLTETLDGFRARLTANAEEMTVEQRQQIIRLVVREVLIGHDDITIRHSIPVPTGDQPPGYLLRSGSREEPDPGARSHPAIVADEARPGRDDDPRLQAQRTTTLFAALDVLTGSVIGQCLPRHRHSEFLKFLKTIDREVSKRLKVHLILDNYATHNHPNVKAWLARHPRFQLHFTPTSSSWLNMVELFFSRLTDKAIRRGIFHNVPDLIAAIEATSPPTMPTPSRSGGLQPPTKYSRKSAGDEPWPVWVYLNGNEWAKQQAARQGIAFRALDNGFAACDDPQALAQICHSLSAQDVRVFFERWQGTLPAPLTAEDRARGYGHALAFRQREISDTRTFDRPAAGRAWFEATIPDQLTLGRPDQAAVIFGRRVTRRTRAGFTPRSLTAGPRRRSRSTSAPPRSSSTSKKAARSDPNDRQRHPATSASGGS